MIGSIDMIGSAAGHTWADWVLGLDRVSWADRRAVLGWGVHVPGWGWVLIVVAAVGLAHWSYRRQVDSSATRLGLVAVRSALIVLLGALLAGPVLMVRHDLIEPDWLLVLVDRSASMGFRDAVWGSAGESPSRVVSRTEAVNRALVDHADLFEPQRLGRDRRIEWLGFDEDVYPIEPLNQGLSDRGPGRGRGTALRTAIERAMQRAVGRPISGIVLITDGRSPQAIGGELVRELQKQAVSVVAVPVGGQVAVVDLVLSQVQAPQRAFVNDPVPVNVWVEHYPQAASLDTDRVGVRLVDVQTGRTLDERRLGQDSLTGPVRLTGRSAQIGPVTWRVQLFQDNGAAVHELVKENNERLIDLELVDRPVRVLYIEEYPRWDYRYLKNLLIRERSIESSVILINADRRFAQEGDQPLTRIPRTGQEMRAYDVIMIGDVPSGYFTPEQMVLLRDHVAGRGAGVLWIGGPRHTPRSYAATALADLLPMRDPRGAERLDAMAGRIVVEPTGLADSLHVLQLEPEGVGGTGGSWPRGLPGLAWAQDIGAIKPSAEVLAAARGGGAQGRSPLVVRMRYGAGQSVYVATDETWRWRYGRGDVYFDRFWVQLVRMLGRERVQQASDRVELRVSSRRVALERAVVVEVHLHDGSLVAEDLTGLQVDVVSDMGGLDEGAPVVDRLALVPRSAQRAEVATTAGPGRAEGHNGPSRVYRTVWYPPSVGRYVLRIAEPTLEDLSTEVPVQVVSPDDELHQPLPDHDRLAALAEQTGGGVVGLEDLDRLIEIIPNRARRTPNDDREALWDSPLSFVLVMVLTGVEWIGRKRVYLA